MIKLPSPKAMVRPLLSLAARHCPFALQRAVGESLLKKAFAEAIEDGDLDFIEGRFVSIDISDLQYAITLTFSNDQLHLVASPSTQPSTWSSSQTLKHSDVIIRGELKEFIRLAGREEDPDTLFFQRRLCLEGDTELGLGVKNLIDSIDLTSLPHWLQKGIHFSGKFQRSVLS